MDEKLNKIIHIVCDNNGVGFKEFMKSNSNRKQEYVQIRRFIMWLYRQNTKLSLANLGGMFGQDHATALHAVRQTNNYRETNKKFLVDTNELLLEIRSIYPEFNKPDISEPEPTYTQSELIEAAIAMVHHSMDDIGVYRLKAAYGGDLNNYFKPAQ